MKLRPKSGIGGTILKKSSSLAQPGKIRYKMGERRFHVFDTLDDIRRNFHDLRKLYTPYVNEVGVDPFLLGAYNEIAFQFESVLNQYSVFFAEQRLYSSFEGHHSITVTDEDLDDTATFMTVYSNANSSTVTDYGFFYTRHAFNSSPSLRSRNSESVQDSTAPVNYWL